MKLSMRTGRRSGVPAGFLGGLAVGLTYLLMALAVISVLVVVAGLLVAGLVGMALASSVNRLLVLTVPSYRRRRERLGRVAWQRRVVAMSSLDRLRRSRELPDVIDV